MPSRKLLIGMIAASLTSGVALGMSTPTTMQLAPEPEWRSAWRDLNAARPQYVSVDGAPVDLSPSVPVAAMRVADWEERQLAVAGAATELGARPVQSEAHYAAEEPPTLPQQPRAVTGEDVGLEPVEVVQRAAGDPFATESGKKIDHAPLALAEPATLTAGDPYAR